MKNEAYSSGLTFSPYKAYIKFLVPTETKFSSRTSSALSRYGATQDGTN